MRQSPGPAGERLAQRRLAEVAPITTQANISTDGAMMLVRQEGWKEVKVLAISEVRSQPASARTSASQPPDTDPLVILSRHSYQAGCGTRIPWPCISMPKGCGAPGLLSQRQFGQRRRPVDQAHHRHELPRRAQIVDWSHAAEHLWAVANAVHGERNAAAQQWMESQLDRLWSGQVAQVVEILDQLDLQQPRWPDLVQEAPDYFRSNQDRMHYDHFRAQSYPIGSGTVESAANTVIHHRLRRPGGLDTQQWSGHVGRLV